MKYAEDNQGQLVQFGNAALLQRYVTRHGFKPVHANDKRLKEVSDWRYGDDVAYRVAVYAGRVIKVLVLEA